MAVRFKYGVFGGGAVSASLIGLLPSGVSEIGPVSAISYRLASRIANTLKAGYPVRAIEELNEAPSLLFHSPTDQMEALLGILREANIEWSGKSLIFCDCSASLMIRRQFEARGASVAVARRLGTQKRLIIEAGKGSESAGMAVRIAGRIASQLRIKTIEIEAGASDLFDAAVTLGSGAMTPLIDRAAAMMRASGIRDIEAARLASALFEQTARDYAHSGKQSWAWYAKKPPAAQLCAQIDAAGAGLEPVLRMLLLFGFEAFQKHRDVGTEIKAAGHCSNEE